jgi:predicted site-specific integrase-resolvase
LERIHRGDKLKVVVAHKDCLARFGTEVFAYLLEQNGSELVVLNRDTLSPEEEVYADILSILTGFSARVNGLRRYHN